MVENITDDCKMITTEHEMRVDGHRLIEKKQTIHFKPDDDEKDENGLTTGVFVHERIIDKRCYKVTVTEKQGLDDAEKTIDTDMNKEETEIFEQDWKKLWIPHIESAYRFRV